MYVGMLDQNLNGELEAWEYVNYAGGYPLPAGKTCLASPYNVAASRMGAVASMYPTSAGCANNPASLGNDGMYDG